MDSTGRQSTAPQEQHNSLLWTTATTATTRIRSSSSSGGGSGGSSGEFRSCEVRSTRVSSSVAQLEVSACGTTTSQRQRLLNGSTGRYEAIASKMRSSCEHTLHSTPSTGPSRRHSKACSEAIAQAVQWRAGDRNMSLRAAEFASFQDIPSVINPFDGGSIPVPAEVLDEASAFRGRLANVARARPGTTSLPNRTCRIAKSVICRVRPSEPASPP